VQERVCGKVALMRRNGECVKVERYKRLPNPVRIRS
jgi:hypothetical protein